MELIHSRERCSVAKLTPESIVRRGATMAPVRRLLATGIARNPGQAQRTFATSC